MKISANIKFDIDKVYGFFYSLNPDATAINKSSMDYKKGRDNMKLDIMRAIMESKSSTKSFLQPGGFKDLKENNHLINDKKVSAGIRDLTLQDGEYIEENNPIKPYTWINTANRMITGKALIGVSANANAAHAIFQHADELRLIEGFQFNGFTYDNLNKTNVIGTTQSISAGESKLSKESPQNKATKPINPSMENVNANAVQTLELGPITPLTSVPSEISSI